jgi:hypothetical protein
VKVVLQICLGPRRTKKFGVPSGEARTILTKWMQTFEKRHPNGDASRGHLAVGATDAMPARFACDSITRSALVIDRIGDFVLLEGMALDSGFYFTQGPGGPRKFNARQEALDYIEYAQDDASNMFEGMDIEKASISYVKPEPLTAAQKASGAGAASMRKPLPAKMPPPTPPMKRGLMGTPAPDRKLRARDAELFPGSSQKDPERAELYKKAMRAPMSQKERDFQRKDAKSQGGINDAQPDPRQRQLEEANSVLDDPSIAPERKAQASKMIRKPGKDADPVQARLAPEPQIHMKDWIKEGQKRAASAREAPEPQIHMKDWLKAHGQYGGKDAEKPPPRSESYSGTPPKGRPTTEKQTVERLRTPSHGYIPNDPGNAPTDRSGRRWPTDL